MKLINLKHRYDFGHDWYVQILNTGRHFPRPFKNISLLQISISWNDIPSYPYLQIKSGTGDVLDVLFWVHKFGLDVTILGRTWNWDFMQDIQWDDDDETTTE
jgi:hypothetical protein